MDSNILILKNVGNQTILGSPLTSILWAQNTMEVNGNQNSLLPNILQINIFCSPPKKKKIHDMKVSKLSFLDGLFLKGMPFFLLQHRILF